MKIYFRDIQKIWYFFRLYKRQSCFVLLLMFISGTLEMINLAALYPIINYGLNIGQKSRLIKLFEAMVDRITPDNPFLGSCLFLIVISVFALVFKFLYQFLSNKLLVSIVGNVQKQIFDKLTAADHAFYINNQQGNLIYASTVAIQKVTAFTLYIVTFFYHLINSLFLLGLLVFLSWQATSLIFITGIFYGLVIKKIMSKYINKCAAIYVEENRKVNVILNEFISGYKMIKIYQAISEWRERFVVSVDKGLDNRFHMYVARAFPETFVKFLFYLLIALTGIFLSYKSQDEIISLLPLVGTFAVVVNRFLPSINSIGSGIMRIGEHLPDTKIVYDLCHEDFSYSEKLQGQKMLAHFEDKIVFENVTFRYPSMGEDLLRNLTFSINKKKMTALVGYSGSGKTTIINLLLKLYRPDQGRILIDGEDIFTLTNSSYFSKIGYVSQETFIFNSTIKENIRFGMENCSDQMIEEAAKLANAHDFIMETSEGYDTVVGDSGVKLSGGQRQRIAISRAMLRNPEIMIFDEATSSLDNISEKKIQSAINNISKHTTVLVIAHRLSTVKTADKIIILEKGEIKEQGTHEELMENKDIYYHLHSSKDVSPINSDQIPEGRS